MAICPYLLSSSLTFPFYPVRFSIVESFELSVYLVCKLCHHDYPYAYHAVQFEKFSNNRTEQIVYIPSLFRFEGAYGTQQQPNYVRCVRGLRRHHRVCKKEQDTLYVSIEYITEYKQHQASRVNDDTARY